MENWKSEFDALICDRTLRESGWTRAQELKNSHLPRLLYKYCDTDQRRIDILESGRAWLSDPKDFNDPLDCIAAFDVDVLIKEIEQSEPNPEKRSSLLVRMIRGESPLGSERLRQAILSECRRLYGRASDYASGIATKRLREGLGVTCFSETNLSAPMWAHYASHHEGFCIQWRVSDWSRSPEHADHLFPVLYHDAPFQMPSLALNPHHEHAKVGLALRKLRSWSYEQEWRYVRGLPLDSPNRLRPIPKPQAVHLGFKIAPDVRQRLIQICQGLDIAVYQVRCVPTRGYLESTPIS